MGAKLDFARGRWIALLLLVWSLVPSMTLAGTTGNLTGYVTNSSDDAIGNARITLTSPSLQGTQTATSDDQGFYRVFALPPGTYTAEVEGPGYIRTRRENITILVDQTIRVDVSLKKIGEEDVEDDVIVITEEAPVVEQGSTTVGANLSGDFLQQVPTGRRMSSVLALTPGAAQDALGTSFGGASSPENAIVIDGLNTTGIDYGLVSTNLPIEFVDQIEVKTAGYGAEYGRATGAFINTILKSGGNEFHGDVFFYLTPIQGNLEPQIYAPNGGDPLTRTNETDFRLDVGFDIGGYLIKDKLWFFAGFMPSLVNQTVTRTLGDDTRVYDKDSVTGYYLGKLTYRINEDHNVVLTVLGNPGSLTGPAGTAASTLAGEEYTYMWKDLRTSQLDGSLRWNSKLANDSINIEFLLGYHRETSNQTPYGELDSSLANNFAIGTGGYRTLTQRLSLYEVGEETNVFDGSTMAAPDCGGRPCDVFAYETGGFGYLERAVRTRTTATLKVTHYINNLVGNHKFLWGGDFEFVQFDNARAYTGGNLERVTSYLRERYFATQADTAEDCATKWPQEGVLNEAVPIMLGASDGTVYQDGYACLLNSFPVVTNTLNASAYVQESWSLLDNLTLNLGMRWEMQQLRAPRTADGELGIVNLALKNNWAPRLGFIFDPTNEGRSKIFGSFGKYYENIPMDINDRAFSFEGIAYYYKDAATGQPFNMQQVFGLADFPNPLTLGGHTTPIEVGLTSQHQNEFLLGFEYEMAHNLAVSVRYMNRNLGAIIEDISPDDGNNYIIANPGPPREGGTEYYDPETDQVFARYDYDENNEGRCKVEYLDEAGAVVDTYADLPCFPDATRSYQSLEFTARKGFSDNWTMMGSYTLSWAYGNYPGLFTPENGQLDPNITSQFDLPSLLTNRVGFLPQDRRHIFKLHGAYTWDMGLQTGVGVTMQSGTPYSTLAAHELYGSGEAFISPRGSAGRTPAITTLDGTMAYFVPLGGDRSLSFELEAFNVLNFQNATTVDQNYTYANAYNPQDGQSIEQALCEYDSSFDADGTIDHLDGQIAYCYEMANPNFGNATAFQSPLSLRLGVKFTF